MHFSSFEQEEMGARPSQGPLSNSLISGGRESEDFFPVLCICVCGELEEAAEANRGGHS